MLNVLVSDDEESIQKGLKKIINSFNLNIKVKDTVDNGKDALDYITENKPEIVIMDINMPLLSGLEVIEQTRKQNLQTIFIVVSGYDYFSYAQKAVELGVSMYLLKPVKIDKLKESLIKAIKEHEKNQFNILVDNEDNSSDPVLKSLNYIKSNYMDKDLSLEKLSQKFFISTSKLSRNIKTETGYTFSEYLNKYRINISKTMLIHMPDKKIVEIADLVGYSSQHYYSRVFKEETGYSPALYREQKAHS